MNYNSPIHKPHHVNEKILIHSYTLLGKNLCDSQSGCGMKGDFQTNSRLLPHINRR